MDWETLNELHRLEQIRGVIRALQTSMIVLLAKIFSNINLKTNYFPKKVLKFKWRYVTIEDK